MQAAQLHCRTHPPHRQTGHCSSGHAVLFAVIVGTFSRANVSSQPSVPIQPIQVPARQFSHIHVDLGGPLTVAADGSTYLLTIIDRTTRWLEVVALLSMEATSCADAFHCHVDLQI
jgi:hypothetical protein